MLEVSHCKLGSSHISGWLSLCLSCRLDSSLLRAVLCIWLLHLRPISSPHITTNLEDSLTNQAKSKSCTRHVFVCWQMSRIRWYILQSDYYEHIVHFSISPGLLSKLSPPGYIESNHLKFAQCVSTLHSVWSRIQRVHLSRYSEKLSLHLTLLFLTLHNTAAQW